MVDLGLAYTVVMVISASGVIGTPLGDVCVSFFSDKGGRRIPIIIMSCIAGAICVISGIIYEPMIHYFNASNNMIIPITLAIIGILRAAFSGGTMTLMWTYLAESYPTKI